MATQGLPAVIDDLRTWLLGRGFLEQERLYEPRSFGDWLIVLTRPPCRVRIVRDRSQWAIDVSGDGISDWYDTDLWCACLQGGEAPARVIPLDDQIAFLRTSLARIDAALQSPGTLDRCLRQRLDERARLREERRQRRPWGLPPEVSDTP